MSTTATATRYHLSKSGRWTLCKAHSEESCPLAQRAASGQVVHVDSATARGLNKRQAEAEKLLTEAAGDVNIAAVPAEVVDLLKDRLIDPANSDIDLDMVAGDLKNIQDWDRPWTPAEQQNLEAVVKIADLVEQEPFTEAHRAMAQKLIDNMEPVKPRYRSYGGYSSDDNSWAARDRNLHSLAYNLLTRRVAKDITVEPVEEVDNPRLMGLREAQEAAFDRYNYPYKPYPYMNKSDETELGKGAGAFFQEAIARNVRGDEHFEIDHQITSSSILPVRERPFHILDPEANGEYSSQLNLASVFPVKELKVEMDRVGIDNVSVTPFTNGREWGNVYTVMDPWGRTRSFAVYEHRNSDSIVINGRQDWDGQELPYAGDSKHAFYAEFAPDDRQRAAQALTFYMMQAQRGTLDEDSTLVENATRRDWNAILSETLPGFKEWRETNPQDRYIKPKDETEDDILKRLDFTTNIDN